MLTFEQMKELVELVARHRLSGLEVERSGFRLKIDGYQAVAAPAAQAAAPAQATTAPRGAPPPAAALTPGMGGMAGLAGLGGEPGAASPLPLSPLAAAAPPPGLPVHAGDLAAPPPGAGAASGSGLHILNSPIVGTFYSAPSPDAPPFVEVGSRVRKGQVLCIIEAMKLMNEIESDVDGVIAEVYPQNAQAVEFGEPLFAIRISG